MIPGLLVLALLMDLALGDPDRAWHPVRLLGRLIQGLERLARRDARRQRLRGLGLALVVVGLAYLAGLAWTGAAAWADARWGLGGWLALGAGALLVWSCVAVRGMLDHARPVLAALEQGDLARARAAVGLMVGRDTDQLDERGVCRALVETVAEGLCDGVLAPLGYALLGGPALALAYRAANTLDSMVGYRDERYAELGWASARLDDLLNWVPARLAAGFTALAAPALGLDAWRALACAWRDAPAQPSPNSGWPEGAFAGALGVQLGGPLRYGGRASHKALLGEARRPLDLAACRRGVTLFLAASVLAVAVLEALSWYASR